MTRALALLGVALGLASAMGGCSLPRSTLGMPGVDASVADGGLDAARIDDTGIDAPADDTGIDAGMLGDAGDVGLDAFADDAGHDANVDAYAPPDMGCSPGLMCLGGDLWRCEADLSLSPVEDCRFGCTTAPSTRCIDLRATHVPDDTLLPSGSTPLLVASGQTVQIDSSTGAITLMPSTVLRAAGASGSAGMIGFSTQVQAGGPELGIFTLSTLTVEAGGTLVGVGSRPLVLLASGDVVIDGTIDVGGRGAVAGAGGYAGGGHRGTGGGPSHGNAGDVQGAFNDLMSGGGGGGHGGSGGGGGDEDGFCCGAVSRGGSGGGASADADGATLLGGSGGGGGADESSGGVGGGGGGALQITSRTRIRVGSAGVIRAVGAGGGHGHEAGGGGGAGGTVFLEALTVQLDNIISVNGGGGGGGGTSGTDGARGGDTASAAAGGNGASGGANGGAGAAGATMDGAGGSDGDGGGGGGGAGGRISFVTMSGARGSTGMITPSAAVREAVATIR